MDTYRFLDIRDLFNNRGTTYEDGMEQGMLTLATSSLPAEEIKFGRTIYYNQVPFIMFKTELYDNMVLESQEIIFNTQNIKRVHFLGCSSDGSFFEWISFLKDTEKKGTYRLALSEFVSNKPEFNNKRAFSMSCVHTKRGKNFNFQPSMWHETIRFENGREINKIRFADNPFMHIFSITLELKREINDE